MPRALEARSGRVKLIAFHLRTGRGEAALSFYRATMIDPSGILGGAPSEGWGVVGISARALRDAGFLVVSEKDPHDAVLGRAHVSATPREVDEVGQIPHAVRTQLAKAAFWVIAPP